jgi:DNA-binding response OmpR family regulator
MTGMIKRLLILDNDEDVLEILQEVFIYEGYEVKALQYTTDIFGEIAVHQPHVIMLDYILDNINGGEICHQIKNNPSTCNLPVIIVSAYPKVIDSLGYYGCDKFIPQPFDIDALVHQVAQLIIPDNKHV